MLKRILTLALSLLLCAVPLTSCATGAGDEPTDVSATPEQAGPVSVRTGPDFDNRFGMGASNLIETEDAYYYNSFGGYYTYYYDKASGERGVLCAKPECVHDETEQNESCNGYTFLQAKSLNLWDGTLHYVGWDQTHQLPAIFSLNLDGTGKTRFTELDLGELAYMHYPQRFDYHRGMLYAWNKLKLVSNGKPQYRNCVFSIDPETGDSRVIYDNINDHGRIGFTLYYFQQYVYICVSDWSASLYGSSNRTTKLELYRWNTETEVLESVFSTGDELVVGAMFTMWMESEDKIYLVPSATPDDEARRAYLISGGELSTAFEFDNFGAAYMVQGAAICIFPIGEQAEIRAADGSLIYSGNWSFDFGPDIDITEAPSIQSCYGDRNTIFIVYSVRTSGESRSGSLVMRYDLTGEKPVGTLIAYSPWD